MGVLRSKLFLELGGLTVLQRVVDTLQHVECIEHIVLLVRESDLSEAARLIPPTERLSLAVGGKTRQESVLRGLEALKARSVFDFQSSLVLVHDAARPMVSKGLVERCIEAARQHGAVTAAVPMVDSVKRVDGGGRVVASLERRDLIQVQTPQVFRFDLLWKAHHLDTSAATDDAALVERIHPVIVVPGERNNIKLTSQEDLEFLRFVAEKG